MNIYLDQRAIPGGFEAVNLAGLDDEYVACGALKRLAVYGPNAAAFADKLYLIVRMPVRPGPFSGLRAEQED